MRRAHQNIKYFQPKCSLNEGGDIYLLNTYLLFCGEIELPLIYLIKPIKLINRIP